MLRCTAQGDVPGAASGAGDASGSDDDIVDAEVVDDASDASDDGRRREGMSERDDGTTGPVIRDKRRIDPETGEVREAVASAAASPARRSAALAEEAAAAAGRGRPGCAWRPSSPSEPLTCSGCTPSTPTTASESTATASWCATSPRQRCSAELLTVLDDIDRATEHGELVGGFKSVAEALEATVTKLGLEKYGDGR